MRVEQATIGSILSPKIRSQLRDIGEAISLERGIIWDLKVRRLVYRGIEGTIRSYFDGVSDCLVFTDFPPGPKWEKLKRSIQSLKRNTNRGRYEVKAKPETEKAEIRLSYLDPDYPQNFSPTRRFARIWQDLMDVLPKRPGLVEKGRAREVKDFILQDLRVKD